MIKAIVSAVAAAALVASSGAALAQTAPGNGQYNGSGYWHTNGPSSTGQPNASCQDINGGNTGPFYPGNTSNAPGSAFNETNGHAGTMYAGSQPQNSRNSSSVAQYDVACSNQPM